MPDFKPMLAHSESPDPKALSYPLIAQPKLDGIRAVVKDGKLLSRTLKRIPNQSIRAVLESPLYEGLDGELIVGDPNAEDVYRRTTSFVMADNKTGEPWCLMVFDKHDEPGRQFGERYESAATVVYGAAWSNDPVFMVPCSVAENAEELEGIEAVMLEHGYEGAILRDPHGLYKYGRSGKKGPLLKLKRYIDFEAEVIGVYEEMHNGNVAMTNALGRTERSTAKAGKTGKGSLGGLILRALNGPAEGCEFRCGTGFDAAQRADLWQMWHSDDQHFPGEVAKIKSFPIGVKDKPRHPVFLGWRDMEIDG